MVFTLEKSANQVRQEILEIKPSFSNFPKLKNLIQKLIDVMNEIGTTESHIIKNALLHTFEQEVAIAEMGGNSDVFITYFKKSQELVSIDFLGFDE